MTDPKEPVLNHPLIRPVILCGGSGTRLWPLSSSARPKQLLALTGDRSMLQMTVARVTDTRRFAAPFVVTGATMRAAVQEHLAAIDVVADRLILEPVGRNTAAAIALAALTAESDELLLVMPSDHLVRDLDAFDDAVDKAMHAARDGWLVTFGIAARHPETGYGYIESGEPCGAGVFTAISFVEKPPLDVAAGFVASGRHLWNSGMFLFRADAFLAELALHAPDILEVTYAALNIVDKDASVVAPDAETFAMVRSQAIDHAVMERAERVAVVPVDMGWSDIGSWDSLYAVLPRDDQGNVTRGQIDALGSRDNLLLAHHRRIVAIGVEDLIVVETPDSILVMRRGESQRVQEVVERDAGNQRR